MKAEDITVANLVQLIPQIIPELRDAYDRQIHYWRPEAPPPYTAYREIIYDSIEEMFESGERGKEEVLKDIFDFLEMLARHHDKEIQNVVYVALCEPMCSNEIVLQKAQKYMGKTTKRFCDELMKPKHKA